MSNNTQNPEPLIPASQSLPEITIKVIVLSILLALIMSAANAYLALKIGQTISASIPASVLAIGILRFFKNSNVLESNLIQTAASAGEGVAAAIAFVLPAMIFIHAWQGFDYWETAAITGFGGLLGVFFSIPLRRVMLSMPTLKFPEGVAVGNVLRATSVSRSSTHMHRLIQGVSVGGFIAFAQSGIQIFSDSLGYWFKAGKAVFGATLGFSPALFAAGYIVGVEVGISLFTGFLIGWVFVLPWLSFHYGLPAGKTLFDSVMAIWSTQLRFVGVGVMLVGGVWTLLRLMKPVFDGIRLSFVSIKVASHESGVAPRTERDIPILLATLGVLICAILLFFFIVKFAYFDHLYHLYSPSFLWIASLITIAYILIFGFFLATICAYFTGLVGSSNNPLSGILIMSILILGAIYWFVFPHADGGKVAAMMVIVTAVMATCASISNENLQDLKAGQMVGATPWKQQVVLGLGVVVSAFIIGPVLELLYQAYGMAGVFPHAGMDPSQMLAAPQAGLMASVIKGIRTHDLPWTMILIGCAIAVAVIVIDELLRVRGRRLPALAVGLGIYLPPSLILPTVTGGITRYFIHRKNKRAMTAAETDDVQESEQCGMLTACGLVAGAALMGVFLAIPFVMMGGPDALSIMPSSLSSVAHALGLLSFLGLIYWMYHISCYDKR
ncbi:MAG: oligopeptide transporter, OPT family [Gammaproteobacteria bacterium RIFCSPLOWO2_02_FULL_42_14]|nr:MAG: oligopeptide transporter, OPT family [Gammaproteobacteria bacterium RIFCSPHIGHO2_02_FULL_42_43]OGT53024.1 MAG: oligopeptide transporter, OPT family [Gammaproteobacteria bacterium RIFCSPHIGHO2_12_FULL_41_25]OGT61204.1 MAG: oligopeptide transporter, OPT family [Gammaproteobacteria bacterium RIFCSPLOWO2_02_FULL_42_14]OGT87131.1 MAG: oligopeptide transporter, OPT family [Gammaproteobacteria bacterium RIFCSPLOWO2_12_FULL_42_18]